MRSDHGSGLTGGHPESEDVRVKFQGSGEQFLHMLVEAKAEHDNGNILFII